MTAKIEVLRDFLAAHARPLDRYRFEVLIGSVRPDYPRAVHRALWCYRNEDGAFGNGIEPDLQDATGQPVGAGIALGAIADAGIPAADLAMPLLDWLARVGHEDGSLPFALPAQRPYATAPFWLRADPHGASLMMTAQVALAAQRAARIDRRIAQHPWTVAATRWCLDRIPETVDDLSAHDLCFSLQLLDVLAEREDRARELLHALAARVPADGSLPVEGGLPEERLHLLDLSPVPGTMLRGLLDPAAVDADLDRLAAQRQPDGGWGPDFRTYSPKAALEWRGILTVQAATVLHANGR